MRLRSFSADSLTSAQEQVRRTLGDDAILVSIEETGQGVRILAALETPDPMAADGRNTARARGSAPPEEAAGIAAPVSGRLSRMGVDDRVIARLLETISALEIGDGDPALGLAAAFDERYRFSPLSERSFDRPLMLVGPPGSGKTVTVAKLAAQTALAGRQPRLATTDTRRAGGFEQLRQLADILGVECGLAANDTALESFATSGSHAAAGLIDTHSINPFDPYEQAELSDFIAAANAEPVLVLAAGGDALEMAEMAHAFQEIGISRLVVTRLDISRRLGGVLMAGEDAGLRFADAGISGDIATGLRPMTPVALARFFFPEAQDRPARHHATRATPHATAEDLRGEKENFRL